MEILFSVCNQCIKKIGTDVITDDSFNYVKAKFNFRGKIWENTVKTAIFTYNKTSYTVIISEYNDCYIPAEVLKGRGFTIGVMTSYVENDVTKVVYTKPCFVPTTFSCYNENIGSMHETVSQYDQMLAVIAQLGESKVDKISGKGLSDQNFTIIEKAKLSDVETGAQKNVIEHICVNEVELSSFNKIVNIEIPTNVSAFNNDVGYAINEDIATKYETFDDDDVSLILNDNTEYLLISDTLSTVNMNFAPLFVRGSSAWITMKSGATPVSIVYPDGIKWSGDDISDGEFVPIESKDYTISIWNDGMNFNGIARGVDVA